MEDTVGFKRHILVSTVSYGSYLSILKRQKASPDVTQNGNVVVALKPTQLS